MKKLIFFYLFYKKKETKLLLHSLRNCYNEAYDKYDKLNNQLNIKLQKQNDYTIDSENVWIKVLLNIL